MNTRESPTYRPRPAASDLPDRDYPHSSVIRETEITWTCPGWIRWLLVGIIMWWLCDVLTEAISTFVKGMMQ
jgi:hypothetical protein